jgi:hypothetical protein
MISLGGMILKFEQLDDAQLKKMSDGYCPDCGHKGFVLGPRGGMSINIECGGCRNRFNVASSSHSHRFLWGQRIDRAGNWGERRE